MAKVVVIGAGIAGLSAAAGARKAGAEVILLEKQDQVLGIGRIAGSMDVGGRYPLHLEAVEMGSGEVNAALDSVSYDNMDNYRASHYPHHSLPGSEEMTKHSWVYNVMLAEPALRKLMVDMGVEIRWRTRVVDVEKQGNHITRVKVEIDRHKKALDRRRCLCRHDRLCRWDERLHKECRWLCDVPVDAVPHFRQPGGYLRQSRGEDGQHAPERWHTGDQVQRFLSV